MRASLTAHLLSETTAKTLKYFGEQGLLVSKNWAATRSNFTELTDSWFDLMNSRVKIDNKKRKRHAYGFDLERKEHPRNNDKDCPRNEGYWTLQSLSFSERYHNIRPVTVVSLRHSERYIQCVLHPDTQTEPGCPGKYLVLPEADGQ